MNPNMFIRSGESDIITRIKVPCYGKKQFISKILEKHEIPIGLSVSADRNSSMSDSAFGIFKGL